MQALVDFATNEQSDILTKELQEISIKLTKALQEYIDNADTSNKVVLSDNDFEDEISKLMALPLNTIFLEGAKKITDSFIKKYNIKSIEVYDNELKTLFLNSYRDYSLVIHKTGEKQEFSLQKYKKYSSDIFLP